MCALMRSQGRLPSSGKNKRQSRKLQNRAGKGLERKQHQAQYLC